MKLGSYNPGSSTLVTSINSNLVNKNPVVNNGAFNPNDILLYVQPTSYSNEYTLVEQSSTTYAVGNNINLTSNLMNQAIISNGGGYTLLLPPVTINTSTSSIYKISYEINYTPIKLTFDTSSTINNWIIDPSIGSLIISSMDNSPYSILINDNNQNYFLNLAEDSAFNYALTSTSIASTSVEISTINSSGLPIGLTDYSICVFNDNYLVAGGVSSAGTLVNTMYYYNGTNFIELTATLLEAVSNPLLISTQNGVYVIGGDTGNNVLSTNITYFALNYSNEYSVSTLNGILEAGVASTIPFPIGIQNGYGLSLVDETNYSSYLVTISGNNGTNDIDSIYVADLSSSSVPTFTLSSTSLPFTGNIINYSRDIYSPTEIIGVIDNVLEMSNISISNGVLTVTNTSSLNISGVSLTPNANIFTYRFGNNTATYLVGLVDNTTNTYNTYFTTDTTINSLTNWTQIDLGVPNTTNPDLIIGSGSSFYQLYGLNYISNSNSNVCSFIFNSLYSYSIDITNNNLFSNPFTSVPTNYYLLENFNACALITNELYTNTGTGLTNSASIIYNINSLKMYELAVEETNIFDSVIKISNVNNSLQVTVKITGSRYSSYITEYYNNINSATNPIYNNAYPFVYITIPNITINSFKVIVQDSPIVPY